MIGKTVSHYKIVEELGRGGMGVVYKAEDTKLRRTVALKFLPSTVGPDERARFEQEAQAAAHLHHPNICTIYEINEHEGQPYIAMAYIDGVELRALTEQGPMALDEAVSVAIQVAAALEEAHDHGIVHRDIKSANVMIDRKGRASVMDFGLAKRRDRTQITVAGTSMGTIDYMSPEQTRGEGVDHRTDIWSFGVMLYEMIAGEMPFRGDFDQAVIYSILNEDPKPLAEARPETPALLADVTAKAMAKRPDDRYQGTAELLDDLHAVQQEVGVPSGTSASGAINWSAAGRPSTGGSRAYTAGAGPASRAPAGTTAPRGSAEPAGTATRGATPAAGSTAQNGAGDAAAPAGPGTFDARAFAIAGGYAVIAAIVVAGLHWLANHYPVSPNLPEFGLWTALALLPTVAVLAFFRGGAGRGANRVRLIGVPATLLAAAVLLGSMFGGRDLGAATRTVTVTDEEGNTVEREVPKSEFRKRVALFYFDNEGDPDDDWLSYGLAHMIRLDLSQDIYVNTGMGFTRPHKEAGFDTPVGSPIRFKQKLADDYHYPYFVVGSLLREDGMLRLHVATHDAEEGAVTAEHTFRGSDVFLLADSVSAQIRRDIGIPEYHVAESTDSPVSEMFTNSLEALRHFVLGVNARWQQNDYGTAIEHLESAIEIDPAFAVAHQELLGAYINTNQGDAAQRAVRAALQHKYKLPERSRFSLMSDYHEVNGDAEAIRLNAERWVSLYPDDVDAYLALAQYYQERANDIPAAIAQRKKVLEISPERYGEYHTIAGLYEDIGDMEQAEQYLRQYAELFPDKYDSYSWLGAFYRRRGDFERARKNYRQALVIDPERIFIRTSLADLERNTGNFDEAMRLATGALESARTASDSATALRQLMDLHGFLGRADESLEYREAMLASQAEYLPPMQVTINRLFSLGTYVDAGEPERAIAIAREMEKRPAVPWFKSFVAAGYIITYSQMDDPTNVDELERYLETFTKWVEQSGMHQLDWVVRFCRSIGEHWRGDNETALASIESALETVQRDETGNLIWMYLCAAEYARELGRYTEAETFIEELLKIEPWSPEAHYEMSRIQHEQGNIDAAREHIDKAMKVWEHADPGHPRATEARKFAELLRSSI